MTEIVAKKIKGGKVVPIQREDSGGTLPAWESREVFTQPIEVDGEGSLSKTTRSPSVPNASHLPRSARSPRGRLRNKSYGQRSQSVDLWRRQKSLDIVAFNGGAEQEFCLWLESAILAEEYQAVSIGWVLSNGAFHLDVSIETVKRYLGKYTADLAPFHSDGKIVTLRRK